LNFPGQDGFKKSSTFLAIIVAVGQEKRAHISGGVKGKYAVFGPYYYHGQGLRLDQYAAYGS